jgi:hypothetical protein
MLSVPNSRPGRTVRPLLVTATDRPDTRQHAAPEVQELTPEVVEPLAALGTHCVSRS